jgi:hypothetical protein
MSKKHYGDHPDYAGEVDHAELIARMEADYDAWVLHTGSAQLREVLALCPDDVRILVWTKGWASFKPGVPIKYAWEPIIIRNERGRGRALPMVRDWMMCNVTTAATGAVIAGQKPRALCDWIFECLGLGPDDELDDLFPGSGAVSDAWTAWRSQLRLEGVA